MKYIIYLFRLLIGGFFIFSGYVKAVDPMGTGFKMQEYFEVFTEYLPALSPLWDLCAHFALPISVFMIVGEMALGIMLILGVLPTLTLWGYALLIGFFTILTGFSAYTNKVTDCGCFGDFLKLKPIETFGKDVILCALVLLLIAGRKHIVTFFNNKLALAITGIFTLACLGFSLRNIWDEPIADFRPYKVGANICEGKKTEGLDQGETQIFYTLVKQGTKETKEVESKQYLSQKLYEDKTWEIDKEKTRKVVVREAQLPKIKDFAIHTPDGIDITDTFLARQGYQFIVSCYDMDKADKEGFKRIAALLREAAQDNVPAIGVTNAELTKIAPLSEGIYTFYSLDATPTKTMIRANPGLVLVKDCVVEGKWNSNHLPAWQSLKEQLKINKQPAPTPLEPPAEALMDSTALDSSNQ
jgi:uncharacterized membrane protein YphA (DoxX/SURF4 family)